MWPWVDPGKTSCPNMDSPYLQQTCSHNTFLKMVPNLNSLRTWGQSSLALRYLYSNLSMFRFCVINILLL